MCGWREASSPCPRRKPRRSTRSPPTTCCWTRSARRSRRPTSPSAAPSGRRIPREMRDSPATLDEFRGLFSESTDPRQWPHIATGVTYRRAIKVIAEHLGCEPDERAVYEGRLATDPREYARSFVQATNTELLLLDDGYPPTDDGTSWEEFAEWVTVPARPVLRLETHTLEDAVDAREQGYV